MQSVRLHIDGAGEVWVLSKCRACGEVDKHWLRTVMSGWVSCRKCGSRMDIIGATIEAVNVEASKISGPIKSTVKQGLERDGLRGAVRELNRNVPHRYTGIFLKEGPMLRNVALFDKKTPDPQLWPPFPLGDSFCSIIIDTGAPLQVNEARTDFRDDVKKHPAGYIVQAYCGVPLIDPEGRVLGSLCHFDEQPIAANLDLVDMLQITPLLRLYLEAHSRDGHPLARPRELVAPSVGTSKGELP